MPSRLTVPVDSVSAGPAPLLTDITMPSVMPGGFSAVPPPTQPTQQDHQQQQERQGRRGSTTAAPTSIIRKSRDGSATRGGRVTFAGDTARRDRRRDDDHRPSNNYRDGRRHQHQQHQRKASATNKTPASSRSVRSSSSRTSSTSSSSTTKKSESACRNRLESALRDQFDSSFTGSQGLSSLIGRRDVEIHSARYSRKEDDANIVSRERENVAPNILAGRSNTANTTTTSTAAAARQSSSSSARCAPGPNERLYKDRYGHQVDSSIAKHRRERPDKPLRDYRTMSDNEKTKELDKVGSLLARLGICDNFSGNSVTAASQRSQMSTTSNRSESGSTTDASQNVRGTSSRAAAMEVDESRTTLGNSSQHHHSSRSRLSNMEVDDSRTTLGSGRNNSNPLSRSSRSSGREVDDSRTTLGTERRENEQAVAEEQFRPRQNDTIDDSRTTMDDNVGQNNTTACSSTRLDQSSVVFDFGEEGGGGDGGAVGTPKPDIMAKRRVNMNDDDTDDSNDMIESPREEEKVYQQGITRIEDSHFTCNADAGTVAETQGAASVARPKLLFKTQTPQFGRGGGGNSFDYDSGSVQRPLHKGGENANASDPRDETEHSNVDTTAQSAALLSPSNNNSRRGTKFNSSTARSDHRSRSCSPVELARSAAKDTYEDRRDGLFRRDSSMQSPSFQSPIGAGNFASNRKRLATTSGKKGADQQRSRLVREGSGSEGDDDEMIGKIDDSFDRECPSEHIDSPSQLICSSIRSPPSDFEHASTPSFLAGASQSPILQCDDSMMNEDRSMEFRRQQSPAFGQQKEEQGPGLSRQQEQIPGFSPQHEQSPGFSQQREKSPGFSQQQEQSPGFSPEQRDLSIDGDDDDDGSDAEESVVGRKSATSASRNRRSLLNDSVESVNCTVIPRRDRTRRDRGREYSRDVAPADIHMKKGEPYRLDPLRVRRPVGQNDRSRRRASSVDTSMRDRRGGRSVSRRRQGISRSPPTISFPDPLSTFDRRTAERLEVVADWVIDEDCSGDKNSKKDNDDSVGWYSDEDSDKTSETIGRGVITSMTMPQIVGVTLKLLITNGAKPKSSDKAASPFECHAAKVSSSLNGGTLMVLRSKEDLEEWQRALRERTCFSVMNHTAMSSSERKRSKTSGKCTGFQIVLTTYDALKSKESSFALDEMGRAVQEETSQEGGWYSSRSQSRPLSCEHLSILHQLTWHRVVFVDILGRQSYTAKPGTARSKAAIALNSKSRFIFFAKENGGTGHLEEAFKESTKQLRAIASTLHMHEEDASDLIVGEAMVDLKDVKEDEEQLDVDESRYEDIDDSRYEDGQGGYDDDSYSRCHSDSEILMSPRR